MDLRQHYFKYITAINEGCKPGTLDPFVHEGVVHNSSPPMSIVEYAKNMTEAQASFQSLRFSVDKLTVEPDMDNGDRGNGNVAVRIKLSFEPAPGKEEVFHEHVFYRFEEGKIREVWSMLNGAGLKWSQERAKREQ
jgi:predicted ester cyclase